MTLSTPPLYPWCRGCRRQEEVKVSLLSWAVSLPGEVEAEMFVKRGRSQRAGHAGPGSLAEQESYPAHGASFVPCAGDP